MNDMTIAPDNLDLARLTEGERIWLWRRRQENTSGRKRGRGGSRMSANEAAATLSVPLNVYDAAERDDPVATGIVVNAIRQLGGNLRQRPSPGELCALARRRSGVEVAELCRGMGGISKPTFFSRETAGDQELVDLWRQRGYSF